MSVMFVLIILSLLFATCFLAAFLWAVRSGQFRDQYTPSVRVLFDDKVPPAEKSGKPTMETNHRGNNRGETNADGDI